MIAQSVILVLHNTSVSEVHKAQRRLHTFKFLEFKMKKEQYVSCIKVRQYNLYITKVRKEGQEIRHEENIILNCVHSRYILAGAPPHSFLVQCRFEQLACAPSPPQDAPPVREVVPR
jgi:hypothetical protein